FYTHRAVVPLPSTVQLQPQTHAGTLKSGAGTLRGTVRDPTGAPLPGVTVHLLSTSGAETDNDVTDPSGAFSLDAPPGAYTLRAELAGFQPNVRTITVSG